MLKIFLKKDKITFIFFALIFSVFWLLILGFFNLQELKAVTVDEIKNQISDKEKEIKEIEQKITSYKGLILETRKKENTFKNQISLLNAQIDNLNWNIKLTTAKIKKINLQIEKLVLEIDTQNQKIDNKKKTIAKLMRLLQNYDANSVLENFLNNLSFSNILNQIQNLELLEAQIQNQINDLKNYQQELKNNKLDLEIKQLELTNLNKDLFYQKDITQDKKSAKSNLLKITKNQESLYQKYLKNLQKQRDSIQREIYTLEDKLRYLFDPNSIPKYRSGVLAWPLKGILSQGFGKTDKTGFVNDFYKFHNGIDIAAPIGTQIKSAEEGEIIGVGDLGNYAYGRWIAIKHDNGLITLYAHLSKVILKVGDRVTKDQLIGYVGDTGFSTGPHLHFTVYAANTFQIVKRWFGNLPLGWSINPMLYL